MFIESTAESKQILAEQQVYLSMKCLRKQSDKFQSIRCRVPAPPNKTYTISATSPDEKSITWCDADSSKD